MTTVLADAKLGVMVADSGLSDGDRQWAGRKVFRVRGELAAFSGPMDSGMLFVEWLRRGCADPKPKLSNGFSGLLLARTGLYSFNHDLLMPVPVESGREAIGSGAKGAICAYEALGWKDPRRAVLIACRHDANSRVPVRAYKLNP